ncbi:hypothetical protein CLOSTASPAR_04404 [[Clostridium] asparagiforme DSM 15981]|uniref:Uncharacterized protein n=1 Tax=[Clostridium] asparagiforme DSM 15981 TaxID=518636 RepID=C0D557_9FIRM|nr:hypothetical protein CLOSTASPAR_04404 [[Clostridium] asparagiforme DSM 15981]
MRKTLLFFSFIFPPAIYVMLDNGYVRLQTASVIRFIPVRRNAAKGARNTS